MRRLAVAVWSLAAMASVHAQAPSAGIIRGKVVDAREGTPLERVSVRLQATGRTTITDSSGRFEFTAVAAGEQELYVSAVDFMLVKRVVTVVPDEPTEVTIALAAGTGTYTETVTVVGTAPGRAEPAVAAEQTLRGAELQQLRGVLANDPMRAVQVLPGVATGDDFRSEFAIRGAGIEQMNFTFDGIATSFLLHTVQQVHDTGSVAMINGDVLDEVSLLNGSYPQRFGNRIGAELDFRMREGSRERVQSHVSVSAIDASAVVEGPIGGARRGSWLVSARKSYLDMVLARIYPNQSVNFGFSDLQSKVAYDLNARHQLQLSLTAGQSRLDLKRDELRNPSDLESATNKSGIAVVAWRYAPSARFVFTDRVGIAANQFTNTSRDGPVLDDGHSSDVVNRADWSYAPRPHVTIEGGGEARLSGGTGHEQRLSAGQFQLRESFDDSAAAGSAYTQVRLGTSGGAAIVPGARIDHWSLTKRTTASPWIEGLWPLTGSLTLRGGTGIYRQEPGFAEVLGSRGSPGLAPERAYHVDVGLEGRLGPTTRWQATVYDREDRDVLRLPGAEAHVTGGVFVPVSLITHYQNALDGHARGIEALVERRTHNGLSGSISYAYGISRYRDRLTGESFLGDFDQRHTINAYGNYRVSDRLSFTARFRAGSNFPATGYWTSRGGAYFVTDQRNTLRVPPYSRLDLRLNRAFTWEHKRLTLFAEALNVYDRRNVRFALPSVNRRTFEATNLFETMVPLVPSVGVLVEF